ncbi:hypothetical protein H671_1g2606 [Cricetulus griseus]|uniref:Uncharacterized protein n=1 Tax=Cricetulus griseus TaxID=10029 RepID=A0A061IME6_CRIGR|nr:hypothetical protein H671_1g2606 [Cricetulus griseus]
MVVNAETSWKMLKESIETPGTGDHCQMLMDSGNVTQKRRQSVRYMGDGGHQENKESIFKRGEMSYADIKLVADMDASNHSAGLPSSHNRMQSHKRSEEILWSQFCSMLWIPRTDLCQDGARPTVTGDCQKNKIPAAADFGCVRQIPEHFTLQNKKETIFTVTGAEHCTHVSAEEPGSPAT